MCGIWLMFVIIIRFWYIFMCYGTTGEGTQWRLMLLLRWEGDWIALEAGVQSRRVWQKTIRAHRGPHQLGPRTQWRVTTGPSITPMRLTRWSFERCCWNTKSDHHPPPRVARGTNTHTLFHQIKFILLFLCGFIYLFLFYFSESIYLFISIYYPCQLSYMSSEQRNKIDLVFVWWLPSFPFTIIQLMSCGLLFGFLR